MTDNEIIKAYGCCNLSHDECGGCDNCPCKIEGDCIVPSGFELEREVFNLLHRQNAEIERLQKLLDDKCDRCIAKDRAEAVKEFAERLKERREIVGYDRDLELDIYGSHIRIDIDEFDNLVKETAGED